ncbi:Uncharacterized protein TCM_042276 [Theobroma cacao]|uniref:Uncharacterized protein n=1 Tax=Theobroma cacao TaxID=3641 RepID=A0A061H0F3_THECC|nr:Uncharacterized protein TCM_042276 [Theobroma cacao]
MCLATIPGTDETHQGHNHGQGKSYHYQTGRLHMLKPKSVSHIPWCLNFLQLLITAMNFREDWRSKKCLFTLSFWYNQFLFAT